MNKIKAYLTQGIISSNEAESLNLWKKNNFGEKVQGKIQYSPPEALFLIEKEKLELYDSKTTKIPKKESINKILRLDKKLLIKYPVFKDLREKGHVVKTALKFGADFRVYPKGKKPGKEHAKWLVFAEKSSKNFNWNEFSAKNRVAHSTRKKLLLAIIDDEGSISYYEVAWIKP